MKRSIALIACINLLLVHPLQAGFRKGDFFYPAADLYEEIGLLIQDVENGRKKRTVLDEEMNYVWDPIPLFRLVEESDERSLQLVEQLLKAGADPNVRKLGKTVLEAALTYGSTKGVKLLLEHGADAKRNSHLLCVLAHESGIVREGYSIVEFQERAAEIIENTTLLLQCGFDVDNQYDGEDSALHYLIDNYARAAENKLSYPVPHPWQTSEAFSCIRTLLKLFLRHGASPYKEKKGTANAIVYARKEKVPELANYLEKSRRVYWVTRLLCGKKEDGFFGPFPVEIAECIACYEYGFSWNEL